MLHHLLPTYNQIGMFLGLGILASALGLAQLPDAPADEPAPPPRKKGLFETVRGRVAKDVAHALFKPEKSPDTGEINYTSVSEEPEEEDAPPTPLAEKPVNKFPPVILDPVPAPLPAPPIHTPPPQPPHNSPTPSPQPTPSPPQPIPPPITLELRGPADAVVGDQVPLQAITGGEVSFYKWTMTPPAPGLIVLDGGRSAVFSNRNSGPYQVTVAVSGVNGLAISTHTFELVDAPNKTETQPVENPPPPHQQAALTSPPTYDPTTTPQITLGTQLPKVIATVPANPAKKLYEIRVVGACFRTTQNRLEAGIFTGNDPLGETRKQAILALGNSFPAWQNFFDWVQTYIATMGAVSPNSLAPVFGEVSNIMSHVQLQ